MKPTTHPNGKTGNTLVTHVGTTFHHESAYTKRITAEAKWPKMAADALTKGFSPVSTANLGSSPRAARPGSPTHPNGGVPKRG